MAKLGSFFRRLFSPNPSDHAGLSPVVISEPRKSLLIFPPTSPSKSSRSRLSEAASRSYLVSPGPSVPTTMKQTTCNLDNTNDTSTSNFLSSQTNKINDRRLSAPLITHTTTHHHPHYRSTTIDESTEGVLISSLQRVSSSTAVTSQPHHSVHSLGASRDESGCPSPRPDTRSASFNLSPSVSNVLILPNSSSTNPLTAVSPTTGTPPSPFVFGPQLSSPRVSISSNHSPACPSGMKDTSPTSETTANSNPDRKMSLPARGRRPSMFDPIDPKELQQALYASAAAKAAIPVNPVDDIDPTRALARTKINYDREGEHIFFDSLSFENMHSLDAFLHPTNGTSSANQNAGLAGSNSEFVPFYCRFRLLPEKRSLFQTKIVRHPRSQSSYPFDVKQLNEFELSYDQLSNHSIEILLYKVGTVKPSYKDTRVATVKFDLLELVETDQLTTKKLLEECEPSSTSQDPDLGDLLVSLSYLQSAAKLAVVVLEAKNLRPLSIESKLFPEACVKVTLMDRNGKKIKRKKTSVQRASDCPTFNEELVFELRRDIVQEVMIELRVVHESLSYKEQLGSVTFGPSVNNVSKALVSPENTYWSTILSGESLNAQWQTLKLPIRAEESK